MVMQTPLDCVTNPHHHDPGRFLLAAGFPGQSIRTDYKKMDKPLKTPRIIVVDCLRGFALFGLFIVHMVEYFELYWYMPEPGFVHNLIFFLFGGKAYAIFALLFGLSFFIIMDNQAKRGVNFRARFSWRLTLLCILGYLHGVLYSGDILQVLALSGFLLVLIYPLSNRSILVLTALFLLQTPMIALGLLSALGAPALPQGHPGIAEVYANGSFLEVLKINLWHGQAGKWLWMINSGRIWNIVGLFLLGFLLGRVRFFEIYHEKLKACSAAFFIAVVLVLTLYYLQPLLSAMPGKEAVSSLIDQVVDHYIHTGLVVTGVLLFLFAFEVRTLNRLMKTLAPSGRMSLTIYVGQSLFGVPMFYGFGLGLYQGFGQWSALLLGLVLWVVQMILSRAWLSRYQYGPLEWLWRSATYLSTDVAWKRITPLER